MAEVAADATYGTTCCSGARVTDRVPLVGRTVSVEICSAVGVSFPSTAIAASIELIVSLTAAI